MKYRTKLEQLQHEFLDVKHSLEPDPPNVTSNSITYARFFQRFQKVAGMTGTAMDVGNVLWDVYSLSVCADHAHMLSYHSIQVVCTIQKYTSMSLLQLLDCVILMQARQLRSWSTWHEPSGVMHAHRSFEWQLGVCLLGGMFTGMKQIKNSM
jgi:hypothetical protein